MGKEWQQRSSLLLGEGRMEKLRQARVLIVGLGGVGAYAAEMCCRAGVGSLTLVDGDCITETNRNRQLPALVSTLGRPKTEVLRERFSDINPEADIRIRTAFLNETDMEPLLQSEPFDYVIDAIDSVGPKVALLANCVRMGIPVVSAMGAGEKTDPSRIRCRDISQTNQCKLAAAVRLRLRKAGISHGVEVIFSDEARQERPADAPHEQAIGSISYLTALFGCWCASVCLRRLAGIAFDRNK
ncbi:MAG: tRNA threonylcarbamoyladenosine dehydratase [Bacteroidales bacterium]|nr:tRNA threonylcarbamoyladenosine dehydratase [Bacteroidales bacterium]